MPETKPMDQPLDASDAFKADERMRRSTRDLVDRQAHPDRSAIQQISQ